MLMPTGTGNGPRARRRASRSATASAPSLLKPIRLTIARSAGSRASRGRGLPGWGSPVTVPTSTNPNPSAASASMPTAFLSNPAASPSTPGKSMPITRVVVSTPLDHLEERSRDHAPVTGRAARIARKARPCTVSASVRVSTRSNTWW